MYSTPSKATIRAVMSALGKRNRGKRKTLTPAAREQRRNAGIASAKARGFTPGKRSASGKRPRSPAPRKRPENASRPLAQSEAMDEAISRTPNLENPGFYKPIGTKQIDHSHNQLT